MIPDTNRPVYLNLIQIRLPIAGFMSILHRLSGMLMFLAIPFLLYLLDLSLSTQQGFETAKSILLHPFILIAQAVLIWSILHHLLAGIRFLLLDIDIGIDKPYYRYTAWVVTLAAPLLSILIIWGWLV